MPERVDIMLPFYGDVEQFRGAVESVRAQTMTDFRLVCVDDHYPSTAPRDWLLGLGDPRIEYVRNDENLGVARNFNRCLDLVQSEWFVMMGGDDVMLPNYLATVVDVAAKAQGIDVVQPGVAIIDEAGRRVLPLPDRVKSWLRPRVHAGPLSLAGERMAASLTRADWAYFPSLLWRSSTATRHRFDQRFEIALDLALLLDIATDGGSMAVADELCFLYRRHEGSASSRTARDGLRFRQEHELFDEYARRFEELGWKRVARIARRRTVSRLNAAVTALSALLSGHPGQARSLVRYVVS